MSEWPPWLQLLSTAMGDVQRMRAYEEMLEREGRMRDLTRAYNTLSRQAAYQRAVESQSRRALRRFLQLQLERPVPPEYVGEPAVWEAVREHLAYQLDLLGGPIEDR